MSQPAFILSPDTGAKRNRSVPIWIGPGGGDPESWENEIRERLHRIRMETLDHLEDYVVRFREIASHRPGVDVAEVKDGREAALAIKEFSSSTDICVSRSGTVKEIIRYLREARVRPIEAYDQEFPPKDPQELRSWQFPEVPLRAIWNAFSVQPRTIHLEGKGSYHDITGVVGVNAASCEDGSLILMEHFSNISKILARCRSLVFVVALEKIVSSADDAIFQALCTGLFGYKSRMLDLSLARTAGNLAYWDDLMTVEGGRKILLLLLDNGRRDILRSPFKDLIQCIGCRACRNDCPTYPYYGARSQLSPKEYLTARLRGEIDSLNWCTYCRGCYRNCPLKIDIPHMILETRKSIAIRKRFYSREILLTNTEEMDRCGSLLAPVANRMFRSAVMRKGTELAMGLARERPLPRFYSDSFRSWFHRRSRFSSKKKVGYFHGCFVNYNDVDTGKALVRLLEGLGYEVILPPQRCCQTPKIGAGDHGRAMRKISFDVRSLFDHVVRWGFRVVATCPSCFGALVHEFPLLSRDKEAIEVAGATVDFASFLLDVLEKERTSLVRSDRAIRVGYHMPCHSKVTDFSTSVPRILKQVLGLEMISLDRGCCGMSGSFGLKKKSYSASMEIGRDLFDALKDPSIHVGVTECGACKMQMSHGSGKAVLHPLQVMVRDKTV
jgi:glycerol-3-phosphate dehydrogenase subunit C